MHSRGDPKCPGEAAFVGHAAAELAGAKALGMTTIAFNRDDETVRADHVISRFGELPEVLERQRSS
ncbi:MAG: hypothetical protein IIA72_15795 [Proteobacteria bacterium]|nr:hypothetical protein [Pseudomonadota bacterium]